jgi:hypothetical protein
MDTKIWDPRGEHIFDDQEHRYDEPEPGFSKSPRPKPLEEETQHIVHAILSRLMIPFVIILLSAGFISIYLYNRNPTVLSAFFSIYSIFWLAATFIFTIIIKNFLELWTDYRRFAFMDKRSAKVMTISFALTAIGFAAEIFFFLDARLFYTGYLNIGVLLVMFYLIFYYTIITIFYSSSSTRILILGIILAIVLVLLAALSRMMLLELLKNVPGILLF